MNGTITTGISKRLNKDDECKSICFINSPILHTLEYVAGLFFLRITLLPNLDTSFAKKKIERNQSFTFQITYASKQQTKIIQYFQINHSHSLR